MRNVLLTIMILAAGLTARAENFRKWTEAESKRQIEAKIVGKRLDGSQANLRMRDGKSVWIETERLIEGDQEYIRNWVKPVDHITARVKGFGKGWKTIEVTAVAGSGPLTVKAYWTAQGEQPKGYPKVFKLGKGEESTFTYKASDEYTVKAWSGKELVDEERWDSKTGL